MFYLLKGKKSRTKIKKLSFTEDSHEKQILSHRFMTSFSKIFFQILYVFFVFYFIIILEILNFYIIRTDADIFLALTLILLIVSLVFIN